MTARNTRPSNAVLIGTPLGAGIGTLIEIIAAASGFPLPTGAGATLAGVLTGIFAWFAKGGRKGESQ